MFNTIQFYEFFALICIVAFWVLLPLVPAILIYSLFPNTAVAVSGPLASLTVKAGGAFAAYLVVFVVVIPWVNEAYRTVGGWLHPAWTITGSLRILDKRGVVSHPHDTFFQKISVRLQPEVNSFQDPTFTITVPEGARGIPTVFLDTEFGKVQLKLDNADQYNKTIDLKEVEVREPAVNDSDERRPLTVPASSY